MYLFLTLFISSAKPNGRFYGTTGKRAEMRLLDKPHMMSNIECSVLCDMNDDCLGYNYNTLGNECELIDGNQLIITTENENWTFLSKCLQGSSACLQSFNWNGEDKVRCNK